MDVDYTGDFNTTTKDGQTYKVPTSGTLSHVSYSKVIVEVSPLGADVPNVGTASTGHIFAAQPGVSKSLAAAADPEEDDGQADGEEPNGEHGEKADAEEPEGEEESA